MEFLLRIVSVKMPYHHCFEICN